MYKRKLFANKQLLFFMYNTNTLFFKFVTNLVSISFTFLTIITIFDNRRKNKYT